MPLVPAKAGTQDQELDARVRGHKRRGQRTRENSTMAKKQTKAAKPAKKAKTKAPARKVVATAA